MESDFPSTSNSSYNVKAKLKLEARRFLSYNQTKRVIYLYIYQWEYLKFCKIILFCNQTKVSRVLLWIGHVLHKVNSSIGVEGLGVKGVTNLIIRSSGKKDGVWTFNLKYLFSDSPSSSGSAIFLEFIFAINLYTKHVTAKRPYFHLIVIKS